MRLSVGPSVDCLIHWSVGKAFVTRPDTRHELYDIFVSACQKKRLRMDQKTDRLADRTTDRPTEQPADGHTLFYSRGSRLKIAKSIGKLLFLHVYARI